MNSDFLIFLKSTSQALVVILLCAQMFRVLTNKFGGRIAPSPELIHVLQTAFFINMCSNLRFGIPGIVPNWDNHEAVFVGILVAHIPFVVAVSLLVQDFLKAVWRRLMGA
jgi:hypothetical protein